MSGQDSNINSILNAILAVNRGRALPNNIAILNLIKRLLNVLCTFKLRPVSTGKALNLGIIW